MLLFLILLLLNFIILPLSSSIPSNTISMNQTFKDGDHLLISQENNFALGFFTPGSSSSTYLGIWFHKVSLQTVVWVANRNNPIQGSSGVVRVKEGNLVLSNNGNENPVWSTNVSMKATDVVAKLLDSGNLVLVDKKNNQTLWQSFEHPTNTLLPGMKLGLNKKTGLNSHLSSWRSPTHPATGNYSYRLNPSGSPQFFLHNGIKHYWRSHPWPWKRMPFPDIYYYDFINDGESIYSNYSVSHPSFITRIQLDESGNIRGLIWHQTDSDWKQFLISPTDRCDFHGRCGSYGKCDSYNINRFDCTCLPGYEPRFPTDWNLRDERGGCVRKRLDSSSVCGNGEGFVKVESVKLPDTSKAVWIDMKMSEVDCELECRRNCSCSAYSSLAVDEGASCLAWYGDLVDTKTNRADIGYDLYVRVDAIELDENVGRSKRMNRIPLIVSVASAWIIIFTIIYCCFKNKKVKWTRKSKKKRRMFDITNGSDYLKDIFSAANELDGGSSSHSDMVFFNFSTILAATDNFSSANKIGQGGFGIVYKGQLSNGQEIAVKRMSKSSGQGIEEFKNEVMLISKLQHKNLVKLLGCCTKKEEQILIYEYLPNKSLDSFLFDEKKRELLDWEKRLDIIVGIARGILYLHQDSRLTIIHRDLKSSNVLLDAKMNPKVSDFGMAKIFFGDQIQGMTNRVVGTYGYMSPEYAMFGKYSVKSDVFSFGVILLEVISGKKSQGFHQQENSMSLIGHVWELWSEGRVLEIIDSLLTGSCNSDEALRCIQVGLLCVQEDAMERPSMLDVILMLKSETPLPCPKYPAFIFKTSSSNSTKLGIEQETFSVNELTISDVLTR